MDVIQRNLLLDYRERLVADVIQPESLLPHLLSRRILTHEDSNLIQSQATPQARTRQLLDLLPERGPNAFSGLCDALQTHYSWLSDSMRLEGEARISQSQGDEPDFKEELFLDARLRGGVPLPPPNFVFRQNAVQTVRQHLKTLARRQGLVLHGLTGSGKSCLAAAALDSKELVLSTFKGVVLWVSLGDGILPAQRALLNKLDHHWPVISAQPQSNPAHVQAPNTEDVAKETLIARILGSPAELKQGLLVLDDVTSVQAVLAFDIGCRVLLLTQDRSVIGNSAANFKVFEMTQGFTEAESLQLLASSVDLKSSDLNWPQAREIHQRANGFPLVISLIGGMLAQFKEDARHSAERWQQYSDMLKITHRSRRNSLTIPGLIITISQSLKTLDPVLKMRYDQLVVFDEDVNILPEVLATLWGISKYEVEDNMMVLVKKSLASRCWNEELRCYVYGVHYLLLHFLQTNLSDDDIKGIHAELVHRYKDSVYGNWGMLPKDNYAHHFLAQHVVKAGLAQTFLPDILLNLGFVAARLKLSLPGDLLRDFQRLREVLDEEFASILVELEHYESFVRRWGDVIWRRDYLDPIQCALQEPVNSKVRQAAFDVLPEDHNFFITSRVQMTLQIRRSRDSSSDFGSLEIPGEFSAATLCCRKVLLAYNNGIIQLWDLEYSRSIHDFKGLCYPALKLCVSSDHTKLAAASARGEVMLWNLPYHSCTCRSGETPTPPPQLRQWSWQPMHGNTAESTAVRLETSADHTPECCIDFADNGELLAWCCLEQIRVWSVANGNPTLLWNFDGLSKATVCSFGLGDSAVFLSTGDIYLFGTKSGQILGRLATASPSQIAPIRKLPTTKYSGGWCFELCGKVLSIWEWEGQVPGNSWNPKAQVLNLGGEGAESHYTSIAITSDQTILGVVTEDSQLLLWQRASLAPLLKVPVPPERTLLALNCASSTYVRALLGGGGVRSLSVLDLDFDSSPYPLTHPRQPAWCQSEQQWIAQLYPNGVLKILCRKVVYVANKITSMTAEGQFLAMGSQDGLVASVMPCDLPLAKPCMVGRLRSAVTHLNYFQGWLVAATDTFELVVFGHETVTECIGMRSAVIQSYIVHANTPWLLVCSSCGLQAWELGWSASKKGLRVKSTAVDVTAEVHDRVIQCDFDASQFVVALAVSQQQVQIGYLNFDSKPQLVISQNFEVPETISALSLLQGGDLVAVAVLSKQILQVWHTKLGSLVAEIEHEAAASIAQIMFLNQDSIITGGAFLTWWQLPPHHKFDLRLVKVLQMQGQKGTLSFTADPGSNELLISDGRGSLRVVKPVTRASKQELTNLPFPPPMKESLLNLEDESPHNNGTSYQ